MQSPQETQLVRAFIDTKKREIQQAERAYDLHVTARLLEELARPLTHPTEFHASWKLIYVDHFYRDVVKFLFSFVAVHLLPGFSEAQRVASFDAFFEPPAVPTANSISALVAQIAATKPQSTTANEAAADEATLVLSHSVRLLQRILEEHDGVRFLVDQLIHDPSAQTTGRALAVVQPLVSSLCSVPDLVYNRVQRATPAFFAPRHFHLRMCQQLLDALLESSNTTTSTAASTVVFRAFAEKLARIGAMEHLVRAWLSREDLYDAARATSHANLISSLPASAHEAFLLQLASRSGSSPTRSADGLTVESSPQYLLLSYVSPALCQNKQFQYAVAHKLLLAKPVRDFIFLRMLVDVLSREPGTGPQAAADELPIASVFDVLVNKWSADSFPVTADYALNASISFFIRYTMTQVDRDVFAARREWTMKLCKGVQSHMSHSVERVRLLGMRMGESVSKIMSPEQPLDFEIAEPDPVEEIGRVVFDFTKVRDCENELDPPAASTRDTLGASGPTSRGNVNAKRSSKKTKGLAAVDPDELVDSDDEDSTEDHDDDSDSESDSDVSLEAFDMNDDEEDLKAQRPVYIKDLLSGLHADDDRDNTETALADAEALLRRKPKDLHYSAKAVVSALLRIEDKYNTPNFVMLRAKALAAACALSPTNAVPYLQKQALEREQLLQSRLDVLQAMTAAAQELSETGVFRPNMSKSLLQEDIETRTMRGLKTRRFGYRRDPLAPAKKNAFADHALAFFSPLLFGYVEYARQLESTKRLSEVEDVFLAHLLHALSSFVECAGHAPPAVPMAKCLMEFAWHYRANNAAAVRRQVLFAFSRVVLVMPPFLLRQELGQKVIDMMAWLQDTNKRDPDEGCREASRLLLSSGVMPMLTM